jgi:hypothetical protein
VDELAAIRKKVASIELPTVIVRSRFTAAHASWMIALGVPIYMLALASCGVTAGTTFVWTGCLLVIMAVIAASLTVEYRLARGALEVAEGGWLNAGAPTAILLQDIDIRCRFDRREVTISSLVQCDGGPDILAKELLTIQLRLLPQPHRFVEALIAASGCDPAVPTRSPPEP